ncbi:MAG: general secretion pathway protein GspB [Luteimonas sp.]
MSLILEALRKSEAERRRGETPNVHVELSPSPEVRRSGIPAWGWWMIAIVIGATGWWLFHVKTSPAPARVATFAATTPPAMHQKSDTGASPTVRHLTPPPIHTMAPTSTPTPKMTENSATAMPSRSNDLPLAPPRPAEVAIAHTTPVATTDGTILHLSDLTIEERRDLPPLKLSMHMWNDDPAQRFVIVDGNRLHEGDRIGDAIVTTITTDGVILDWNGRRLRLPIR